MSDELALGTDCRATGTPTENLKCLRSLFLTNPQDDLAATRSAKGDRVDGTCEWVLTQHQYTSWLVEESPQLLWLSGAPGIGKTMISSFLIEELTSIAERSPQMTLAYYFCDDKHQKRRTATAILRGLLLQILRQRPVLFKHIQTCFDMSGHSLFTNFHALWRIFSAIVLDPEMGEVCCLIDALDECERDSRQLFLFEFTKLFHPQQSRRTLVKFIITSRRENDIMESLFAVSPAIRHLQIDSGKVNNDLYKFIDAKVDILSITKGYSLELKEKIKFALMEKAGGTFLFVSLILHDIRTTKATFQVQQKLRGLPSDLNKVYDRILAKIDADCQEIARLILCWVALAPRPLKVDELAMILSLGTGRWDKKSTPPKDLLYEFKDGFRCCEPFIYLDTGLDTINLVHQSAKDYLLSSYLQAKANLSQYHIVPDSTNLLMFRTCWKFLSFEEFRQGTMLFERGTSHQLHQKSFSEEFNDKHFFLRYAQPQWQKHALAAGPALATDSMFWNKELAELPTLRDALLLGAAAEGQYVIVQRLLENGAQMNSRDERRLTPLLLASRGGHEKVSKLLLEWLNAGINSPHLGAQIPLHAEAEAGYTTMVKLVSSQDDIGVNSQDWYGRTPLLYAAKNGHEGVMKLLLSQDDIAVNSQDKYGSTPLSYAAKNRHEGVMKLLLSQDDIAVNSQDKYGSTPLSYAAKNGHEGVVKLLLSQENIGANSQDEWGNTPLLYAAEAGHEGVVKLLLSQDDIGVDSQNWYGMTPLLYAAKNGHEGVVKLLLSQENIGANSQDEWGNTPLLYAAEAGREGVVKLLLSQEDIAVNPQDMYGKTPLSWAVGNKHEGVVTLLLSREDIAVNLRDNKGLTALVCAAAKGYERVVRLLLGRSDIDVNSRDNEGMTSLLWAATNWHEAVVKLLLSRSDIEVTSQDLEKRPWNRGYKYGEILKLPEEKMDESNEAAAQ